MINLKIFIRYILIYIKDDVHYDQNIENIEIL